MSNIQNVAVFGTGVLGSQIMMQAAYYGKKVIGYDIEQELLDELPQRWEWIRSGYQRDLGDDDEAYDAERFEQAIANISTTTQVRSEEHTSELQSRGHLVCRLLLEKKKRTALTGQQST